jgi:uncharacterized membrane protein
VSFAAITLCVASQQVFIFVSVYFVIDSVRKLLDTPSYKYGNMNYDNKDSSIPKKSLIRGKTVLNDELIGQVTIFKHRAEYKC